MKKMLVLLALGASLCHTSCTHEKHEKEVAAKLLVTNPIKMDTAIVKEYVCQVHSIQHIDLNAQEKGYLQTIYVDEGQKVKKGQLLFQIMPALYEAEYQKAQAEVKLTEIEYQNTKSLADRNVVAPNELAMAGAKVDKAKAELALTKIHLAFTQIRAPFDGIIDRFHVRSGSLVEDGDLLTTLSDNSKVWVYFNVPEAEYLDYKSQTKDSMLKVTMMMANHKVFGYTGIVETIEAEFNNETGNIPFRATFPNPDGLLRHGETGSILVSKSLKGALLIPQKATFEVLDKRYVFVVGKDSVVRTREISIAAEMEDLYAVSAGLTANDMILLEGMRKVKENDKIAYNYEAPSEVIGKLKLHAE